MGYSEHQAQSQPLRVRCAVVTLSDTRTQQTDTSGQTIKRLLESAGHAVADYRLIKDEPDDLRSALMDLLSRDDVDVILTNGGTGISPRDQTVPVIERMIDTPLPGFGELFRMLSYDEIAAGAMLSRAVAGIARGKPIFAMPGSTKA
ncbi:MAG: MogA/MoaB family molybdenum cofactor biosynthesis protein, partial [Tepidisphaeraceae bacterium]